MTNANQVNETQGVSRQSVNVPRTLAVTGGKGGVGKTQVALNLALVLAQQGQRTLLLDGDTELANVNVMLGLYPSMTLEHVILGERSLSEVLLPVTKNLDLLPGASGVPGLLDQPDASREQFMADLAALEKQYDTVVIDTSAGLRATSLHMVAASHLACVVITPDPTSLTDAFSLLKVLHKRGYRRTPSVIVNMAKGATQAQAIYRRFSAAVSRYVGLQTHYLGAIWRDETIAQSVTSQRPVAMMPASDPSCRQFWSMADMLAVRWSQGVPKANGFAGYWTRVLARRRSARAEERAGAAVVSGGEQPWQQAFHAWASDPAVSALERYQVMTAALETIGQQIDQDLVETLQTGLAAMNWTDAEADVRRAAAAHFRQLARTIDPSAGTRPAEARAVIGPGENPPAYDEATFGAQDLLVKYLREHGSGERLGQVLASLRQRDQERPHEDSEQGSQDRYAGSSSTG